MMSAKAPDTAGPECWSQLELDFALVEVNRHYLHLLIDHQNHRGQEEKSCTFNLSTWSVWSAFCTYIIIIVVTVFMIITIIIMIINPQLLSLLSKPHHGGILTGGNMLGNHDHHHHQECIADGLGDVLHAANGEETSVVANPPVTNVPWSNFDGL